MSEWKHDRNYYKKLADRLGKCAYICFCLLAASIIIWFMEYREFIYMLITVILLLLFLFVNHLRNKALKKFYKAPSAL